VCMRINANRFEVKTMAIHGFQQDLTVLNNLAEIPVKCCLRIRI
jgi:hypothetical protein